MEEDALWPMRTEKPVGRCSLQTFALIEIHQSMLVSSKGHEHCSPECLFMVEMLEWLSQERLCIWETFSPRLSGSHGYSYSIWCDCYRKRHHGHRASVDSLCLQPLTHSE